MGNVKTAARVPSRAKIAPAAGSLSVEEKEALIAKYGGHIKYMAQRLATRLPEHVCVDDLIGAGMMGFIDAIEKYDPSRDVKFKTYMEIRVKGAMLDELRALDPISRSARQKAHELSKTYNDLVKRFNRLPTDEEMANSLGVDLENFYRLLDETRAINILPIEYADFEGQEENLKVNVTYFINADKSDPLEQLQEKEIQRILAEAIEKLPEKEKLIVSLYYYDQLTMKEIGHVLNISESRVSQIHSKAMLRLRARLDQLGD